MASVRRVRINTHMPLIWEGLRFHSIATKTCPYTMSFSYNTGGWRKIRTLVSERACTPKSAFVRKTLVHSTFRAKGVGTVHMNQTWNQNSLASLMMMTLWHLPEKCCFLFYRIIRGKLLDVKFSRCRDEVREQDVIVVKVQDVPDDRRNDEKACGFGW